MRNGKQKEKKKREIIDYLNAMAQLNGCCKLSDVLRVYEKNTKVQKEFLGCMAYFYGDSGGKSAGSD